MNPRVESARQLIQDIVGAIVDHPDKIRLTAAVIGGRALFQLRVDRQDYGKICGKQGSHIKALKYLVEEVGATTHDSEYELDLTGNPMTHTPPQAEQRIATHYDPEASRALLERLVREIAPASRIHARDGNPKDAGTLVYIFTIEAQDDQDYDLLLAPYEDANDGLTTASSIGTIWRAAGRKDGVNFRVEVANAAAQKTA